MGAIGVIYGTASSTRFDMAVSDASLRRLEYVAVAHEGQAVLCQVEDVVRKGGLSFDDAMAGPSTGEDRLAAAVQVVGYRDTHGRVQAPATPFAAGQPVERAETGLVTAVLGLQGGEDGAYIGRVKGTQVPVRLGMNILAQKHVSVLAKTGAGKSYTVGVLLEEFLAAGVPLVILDPHGEYGSLRHANIDEADTQAMVAHGVKPRSFAKQIKEYALDTHLNPEADKLRLEGVNLEGHEIVDLLGGKVSGGQVGVLYQAVKEVKDHMPSYSLQDVMDAVQQNRSAAKWTVINALEALQGTGVFHIRGTPVTELVKSRQCTILNLKGVSPDIQEVVVTRLTGLLWEARKRNEVPPFILVCEEAHNFCPERGVGNAISGAVIRTVASEGRKFGMGLVIVSQRPAKIDKNVLSQCNTQFVLKVTNPNDLKAILSSVEGLNSKAGEEVQRLAIGTALIAGGGLTQPVIVDIRPRLTRHGGRSIDVVGGQAPAPITRPRLPRLPGQDHEATPRTPVRHDAQGPKPATAGSHAPAPSAPPVRRAAVPAATPSATKSAAPSAPAALAPAAHASVRAAARPPAEDAEPPSARRLPVKAKRGPGARPPSSEAASAGVREETPGIIERVHRVVGGTAVPGLGPHGTGAPPAAPVAPRAEAPPAPIERASPAAEAARQAAPLPKWSKKDAPAIHRVAHRVGIVAAERRPEDTVEFIQHLARQNGRNPDMRVGLYAEIARTVCHEEAPACIRCPMMQQCQFHQSLQTERKKNRNPIRRLWSR